MSDARTMTPAARVSVAPMMAWTTPAQRYFMRCITQRALLYTEMVTTGALLHGETARFLAIDPAEHPVALQLGGSEPKAMARCAALAECAGFDEVNVNVGCPSPRVQTGAFGACLMAEPARVADCVAHMKARVSIPVSVKTRIGIDHCDDYAFLHRFASGIRAAGADWLIVHARKAWLSGLSPKENREKPPLDYARVQHLAAELPDLPVSLNGGIEDLDAAAAESAALAGVMLGRAAYQTPFIMADVDRRFFDLAAAVPDRGAVVAAMRAYLRRRLAAGAAFADVAKPLLGLFHGQPGGRAWRRVLSTAGQARHADERVLDQALACVTRFQTASAA